MTTRLITEDEALALPLLNGMSLAELSQSGPVLLVFLRHFGCTFCREQLMDLGAGMPDFDRAGMHVVLVHMGTDEYARNFLQRYGLGGAIMIADPKQKIYRSFGLSRARPAQIFSLQVWLRGLYVAIRKRILSGRIVGDPWQMPGLFLLNKGAVAYSFRPQLVSEVPDLKAVLAPLMAATN